MGSARQSHERDLGEILNMLIHSARHITYLGRTLKINSPSEFPNDSTILILSKSMTLPFSVKEKTRVSTEEIAKMTGLRKYLKFSEKTSVKVGSFEMKMADIAPDKSRFNFFINDRLFFLTYIPEICFPFSEDITLLIQADPDYFADADFEKIESFIAKTEPKKAVISGHYAEKWLSDFKNRKNIEVRNEISQQTIF